MSYFKSLLSLNSIKTTPAQATAKQIVAKDKAKSPSIFYLSKCFFTKSKKMKKSTIKAMIKSKQMKSAKQIFTTLKLSKLIKIYAKLANKAVKKESIKLLHKSSKIFTASFSMLKPYPKKVFLSNQELNYD